MPLLAGDIRFAQSVNMADVPEGGGPPSAKLLTSGKSNEIFPDTSEESRTVGRTEVYQIHSMLRNNDRDVLYSGNVILAKVPDDPHVSITLLSLKNPFATRADIARRIESGMSAGVEFNGYLLEDHFATSRSIAIMQRPGSAPPAVGKTYILVWHEGQSDEKRQRVRIKNVETETRIFYVQHNNSMTEVNAQVNTCELFDGLLYDFKGSPPDYGYRRATTQYGSVIRETVYSDSGMFYSASHLTKATAITDVWLEVGSVYTQIVPNNRTETVSVDQRPTAQKSITLQTAPRVVEVGVTPHTQRIKISETNSGFNYVFQCASPPAAGTVHIDYWSMGQRYNITDNGQGGLSGAGGGQVSYLTGIINVTLAALPDIGSCVNLYFGEHSSYTDRKNQAVQLPSPAYFFQLELQNGERVVPNSLTITWMSGGQLRSASSSGKGISLEGDGRGLFDQFTGFVRFVPYHMPDAGAQLQIAYQTDTLVTQIITNAPTPDAGGFVVLNLDEQPVPGSVVVEWYTARETSSSSGGQLNEDSQRKFDDIDTVWHTASYSYFHRKNWLIGTRRWSSRYEVAHDVGSIHMQSTESEEGGRIIAQQRITDNTEGKFIDGMGTVDYAGKKISLKVVSHDRRTTSYKNDHEDSHDFERDLIIDDNNPNPDHSTGSNTTKGGDWGKSSVAEEMLAGQSMTVHYRTGLGAPIDRTQSYTPADMTIDLCPYTTHRIVHGSVLFNWMGHEYSDFEGKIYRARTSQDAGIASGTIDYAAGLAIMTDWVADGSPENLQVQSLWTQAGQWTTSSVFFSTSSAPLRPGAGGFVLTVVDTKGKTLTANVDGSGNITGQHMRGKVEFKTGSVELQFGDYVLDAELSAAQKQEWWYDANDVWAAGTPLEGKIWLPHAVDPSTLRYSYVSYIYLPVDSSLMGIDPAGLPVDGRVPFARPGDTCVIGQTHEGPAFAPAVGNTYSVGHTRLSFVQVVDDATGHEIREGYTQDLDAGTVTFTDLTGWPAAVRVVGRTEVYRQIAEVRMDGKVRLTQPVAHVFPKGAVFSTALRQGDRFARVVYVFDQRGWDGFTWMDSRNPNNEDSPANYNTILYPIQVTNLGAITERWALRFHSTTHFVLMGEHLGQIAAGNVNEDFAPINPASGAPYFTLLAAGWGGGWAQGDVLFIKTIGAEFPIACVRCIMPSTPIGIDDSAWIVQRGDVARPPHP